MDKILHHQGWWLSHYLKGFNHPRWCRILSISSISSWSIKIPWFSMVFIQPQGWWAWFLPTIHRRWFDEIFASRRWRTAGKTGHQGLDSKVQIYSVTIDPPPRFFYIDCRRTAMFGRKYLFQTIVFQVSVLNMLYGVIFEYAFDNVLAFWWHLVSIDVNWSLYIIYIIYIYHLYFDFSLSLLYLRT